MPLTASCYFQFWQFLHRNKLVQATWASVVFTSSTRAGTVVFAWLPHILVPRGRAPFGQHQESRPLAWSNDIPFLNSFVNTIDWDQNQSDLSNLTLNMRRVTGSPWIADFRCWTWPEVGSLGADQKERGLWGREWVTSKKEKFSTQSLVELSARANRLLVRANWLSGETTDSYSYHGIYKLESSEMLQNEAFIQSYWALRFLRILNTNSLINKRDSKRKTGDPKNT